MNHAEDFSLLKLTRRHFSMAKVVLVDMVDTVDTVDIVDTVDTVDMVDMVDCRYGT